MVIIMTLWIGNGAVLKSSSQWQLTHYHTMPHFDALKKYSYGKHCEERRNCLFKFKHIYFTSIEKQVLTT